MSEINDVLHNIIFDKNGHRRGNEEIETITGEELIDAVERGYVILLFLQPSLFTIEIDGSKLVQVVEENDALKSRFFGYVAHRGKRVFLNNLESKDSAHIW